MDGSQPSCSFITSRLFCCINRDLAIHLFIDTFANFGKLNIHGGYSNWPLFCLFSVSWVTVQPQTASAHLQPASVYHWMPNPVLGRLQPAVKAATHSPFLCWTRVSPTERQDTREPPVSHFGLPPWAVSRLKQLLSCCKLLLFTFAPGSIFHPWLDGAIDVRPLPVLLGGWEQIANPQHLEK